MHQKLPNNLQDSKVIDDFFLIELLGTMIESPETFMFDHEHVFDVSMKNDRSNLTLYPVHRRVYVGDFLVRFIFWCDVNIK